MSNLFTFSLKLPEPHRHDLGPLFTEAMDWDDALDEEEDLEARRDGVADAARRVLKVVGGAGHTIVVSGSTLVACFLGLLVFPSALLRGIGVCVSVGLCTAMAMNLTLSPALLHVLNHFGSSLFSFKPSLIVSYSAGQWGGVRAANALRPILSALGALPVSAMIHVPKAGEAFDEDTYIDLTPFQISTRDYR